ncbi:hypothetical protein CTAYLR_000553 [Chrysophaeum taylorii]|uniref:Alpha-type protein kinase domain-containing protein n=1 Tax=Chrysophaeum taylorii TaxID=2483200 RepID=A0AAD7XMA1_9STRA|nr:hypothetical protein CTAYLR_000553 [Chrysophaeum taylorii]
MTARKNKASHAEICTKPFASGTFRDVYEGRYTSGDRRGERCVCKVLKRGPVFDEIYFRDDIRAVDVAIKIAAMFDRKKIRVNKPSVWRCESGQRELVEPWIHNYEKFNSNTGWNSTVTSSWHLKMQALSHFSFHASGGELLLCDLQGGIYKHGVVLTDPVVMSRSRSFGLTDLGPDGIRAFFDHHVCNCYCRHWLKPKRRIAATPPEQRTIIRPPICDE